MVYALNVKASLPSLPPAPQVSGRGRFLSVSSRLCSVQVRVEFPEGAGARSPEQMSLSGTGGSMAAAGLVGGSIIHSLAHSSVHRVPPLLQAGTSNIGKASCAIKRGLQTSGKNPHDTATCNAGYSGIGSCLTRPGAGCVPSILGLTLSHCPCCCLWQDGARSKEQGLFGQTVPS